MTALALRLFFRVEPPVDVSDALRTKGPVIFVGNHPNGIIDPGLIFILAKRRITFLAKAPLFDMPVLGWLVKSLGALPVYRKQDGADTAANDTTLTAATNALVAGRAITLFPEGKSHSEPQMVELKTGCARIALEAARKGAKLKIVPVGLTYANKQRFRSQVHVEVGPALEVVAPPESDGFNAARALTQAIADALRAVTLNVERRDDVPLVQTAEALYALQQGDEAGRHERVRAFAQGLTLLRAEQPERFEALRLRLVALRRRLELVRASASDVRLEYRPASVARFVARNAASLLALPLFIGGMALFFLPYWLPLLAVRLVKPPPDLESTVKVLASMLVGPAWLGVLVGTAAVVGGPTWALAALLAVPALALFTRSYLERRAAAWDDARLFFLFWSRRSLKAQLMADAEQLAGDISAVAEELKPRVLAGAPVADERF